MQLKYRVSSCNFGKIYQKRKKGSKRQGLIMCPEYYDSLGEELIGKCAGLIEREGKSNAITKVKVE